MSAFEERFKSELAALADDGVSEDDARRVLHGLRPAPQRPDRRAVRRGPYLWGALGAAAAVAMVGSLNVLGLVGDATPEVGHRGPSSGGGVTQPLDGPAGLVRPTQPCLEAVHGAVDRLQTATPVWLPTSGDAHVTDAWTCDGTPVLVFDRDLQVSFEDGWSGVDVAKKWAALARDHGGRVGTVLDRPALIQPGTGKRSRDQVLVVNGDTLIRVLAEGNVDIDRLVALANSLQVPSSS